MRLAMTRTLYLAFFVPLLLILVLSTAPSLAQSLVIEVIRLNQQSAQSLLPVLRPLVPPPGSLNGYQGQLVIKSTPENIDEIKRVLKQLDRHARNLLITVRHGTRWDRRLDRAQGFGRAPRGDVAIEGGESGRDPGVTPGITIIAGKRENRAGVTAHSTRSRNNEHGHQTLRVLEGRPAFISTGEQVPVANRTVTAGGSVQDTIDYKSATNGFYVRARISDADVVLLDVSTERNRRSSAGGGVFESQSAYTTVSTRIGQWIELGGNIEAGENTEGGTTHTTRSRRNVNRQIFLRVDLVR
tara:strand:+ start:126 stop:1022 length:897 start_codon:yes stop_codon:yes gene_type:complete